MADILDTKGNKITSKKEEKQKIPENIIGNVLAHLTEAIQRLISNSNTFRTVLAQCNEMDNEQLKKVILLSADDTLAHMDLDVLVVELRSLLKVYAHILPILSLYVRKVVHPNEPKVMASKSDMVH